MHNENKTVKIRAARSCFSYRKCLSLAFITIFFILQNILLIPLKTSDVLSPRSLLLSLKETEQRGSKEQLQSMAQGEGQRAKIAQKILEILGGRGKTTDIAAVDFKGKPVSVFTQWLDAILAQTGRVLREEELKILAEQLNINPWVRERITKQTKLKALAALNFMQALPDDDKYNVFLLRDAFALYSAAQVLGKPARGMYLSKATFRGFSGFPVDVLADVVIPKMIQDVKVQMGISFPLPIPESRFAEFKKYFYNRLKEELSPGKSEELRRAAKLLLKYIHTLKMTDSDKKGIRFIDTTLTGTLVLFMETLLKLPLRELGLAEENFLGDTDSRMFYSRLSSALSFSKSAAKARELENADYPIYFHSRTSTIDKNSGEPSVFESEDEKVKKQFFFQMVALRNELLKEKLKPTKEPGYLEQAEKFFPALSSKPQSPQYIPYQMAYPVGIFAERKIGEQDLLEQELLKERLARNIFYTNAPFARQEQIRERIRQFAGLVPFIKEYMRKNHPELSLMNISLQGSYLYGDERSRPSDIDLLLVVKGNYFGKIEEEIFLDFTLPHFKNLKRQAPYLALNIIGEDNLREVAVDKKSPVRAKVQEYFVKGMVPFFAERMVVLDGYDFRDNLKLEQENVLAAVSSLLLNTYRRIYEFREYFSDWTKYEDEIKKAVSRLYLGSLCLLKIAPDLDLNPEEIFNLRYQYENREISLKEIKAAWLYINKLFGEVGKQDKVWAEFIKQTVITNPEELIVSLAEFLESSAMVLEHLRVEQFLTEQVENLGLLPYTLDFSLEGKQQLTQIVQKAA